MNIISYISLNNGNETNVMNMVMIDLNHFYKFCLAVYCIQFHLKIVNLSLNLSQVILHLVWFLAKKNASAWRFWISTQGISSIKKLLSQLAQHDSLPQATKVTDTSRKLYCYIHFCKRCSLIAINGHQWTSMEEVNQQYNFWLFSVNP